MATNHAKSSGPDWTDVALAMAEIEKAHEVTITLHIERLAKGQGGQLKIVGTATREDDKSMVQRRSVSRSLKTGSGDLSEVAACSFRLMYELDRDCSSFWQQSMF